MGAAFGRSLIAMGRVKYALHWPMYLRIEFVALWQEVSTSRMAIFGWALEKSVGGSPSKRYWNKAERIAEEMKAGWTLGRQEVMAASPTEGPAEASTEHGTLGNWPSSEENGAPRTRAPKAPASSSPCPVLPGSGPWPHSPGPKFLGPGRGLGPAYQRSDGKQRAGLTDGSAGGMAP